MSATANSMRPIDRNGAGARDSLTNLVEEDPAKLRSRYLPLMAVKEAFKNLKGDLAIRPVFHQLEARIEAHVFIAFLAIACTSRWRDACMRWRRG